MDDKTVVDFPHDKLVKHALDEILNEVKFGQLGNKLMKWAKICGWDYDEAIAIILPQLALRAERRIRNRTLHHVDREKLKANSDRRAEIGWSD